MGRTLHIGSTPKLLSMVLNKIDHHFGRRSSSACAKYAEAFLRISLARRSSRFSRSSSFRRSCSVVFKSRNAVHGRDQCLGQRPGRARDKNELVVLRDRRFLRVVTDPKDLDSNRCELASI